MEYEEFIEYVRRNILAYMENPVDTVAEVHQVVKNNGVVLDGLSIRRKDARLSPNIYLNSFYETYEEGRDIEDILSDIAEQYMSLNMDLDVAPEDIYDFEKVKENLIVRLVSFQANEKQLEECPWIPFEDLAITFRWLVSMDEAGIATVLITKKELKHWDIAPEALYALALANTKCLFPAIIQPLGSMLAGYLRDIVDSMEKTDRFAMNVKEDIVEYIAGEKYRPPLYVLTNEQGINGATCMLYSDAIHAFADSIRHDLYILPSSIHEVLLLPDTEEMSKDELLELVHEANDTVVFDCDILSDAVYYYSRNEKSVKKI